MSESEEDRVEGFLESALVISKISDRRSQTSVAERGDKVNGDEIPNSVKSDDRSHSADLKFFVQ
jgi:hypothetical protein